MRPALLLLVAFPALPVSASAAPACLAEARALLEKYDPEGLAILDEAKSDAQAAAYLLCDAPDRNVPTVVHEMLHLVDAKLSDAQTDAYRIAKGKVLRAPALETWPRSTIAKHVPASGYRDTYLAAGPDDELDSLLEELNAYIQGLATVRKLSATLPANRKISSRDGVATFLHWLEVYFRVGRERHPDAWRQVARSRATLDVLQALFSRAEAELGASLGDHRLGIDDLAILERVYAPANLGELQRLFEAGGRELRSSETLLLEARDAAERAPKNTTWSKETSATHRIELPPTTTVTIEINGKPATLEQLERLLEEQPELANNPEVRKALEAARAAK